MTCSPRVSSLVSTTTTAPRRTGTTPGHAARPGSAARWGPWRTDADNIYNILQDGRYRSCEELSFEDEVDSTYPYYSSKEQREKINSLAAKLESGEPLSEEEVAELRRHVEGVRATAEFLLKEAADLESKLP